LGIEYILLPCEPLRSALEKLRRPALSQLQAAGVVRVEILQTKALALGDSKRVNIFVDAVKDLFS
jgi:hypothetical protein